MYYKLLLLGDTRVGKTTLRRSYMGEKLNKNYVKTLGLDFSVKILDKLAFQIWDIAGEITLNTVKNYLVDSSGVIIVFDVMNLISLLNIKNWLDIVYAELGTVPVIIIGNKIDLRDHGEGISEVKINEIIDNLNVEYMETSALHGENVENIFEKMIQLLGGKSL